MSRMPWRTVVSAFDLEQKVDEAFAALIHRPWRSLPQRLGWAPPVDLYDAADEYIVIIDLPGVLPAEVKVWVENLSVVVHGKRESERWIQAGSLVYAEREHGEFLRRIPLAAPVDSTRLDVSAVHGLLIIRLPKQARRDVSAAR